MTQELTVLDSIRRILSTPLGSRVMMPAYGSLLFELVDQSVNDEWVLDAIRYVSEAIETNEPRCILKKVKISIADTATFAIEYKEGEVEKSAIIPFEEVANAAA